MGVLSDRRGGNNERLQELVRNNADLWKRILRSLEEEVYIEF